MLKAGVIYHSRWLFGAGEGTALSRDENVRPSPGQGESSQTDRLPSSPPRISIPGPEACCLRLLSRRNLSLSSCFRDQGSGAPPARGSCVRSRLRAVAFTQSPRHHPAPGVGTRLSAGSGMPFVGPSVVPGHVKQQSIKQGVS